MGSIFAGFAIIFWGIGDFLIQRSARRVGSLVALFTMTAFGAIVFLPFSYTEIITIFHSRPHELGTLGLASLIILCAGLLQFQALKIGKLSVIEPIYALEIPVTAILAFFVLGEHVNPTQFSLIIIIILGILLVSIQSWKAIAKNSIEAGVWYAVAAIVAMGAVNFMVGLSSRLTSPFIILWFSCTFIALVILIYLLCTQRAAEIIKNWRQNKGLLLALGASDNFAWLAYSASALYLPLAIATSLSESYIAVSALLGICINKEKLRTHQIVGLCIVICGVVILSLLTNT